MPFTFESIRVSRLEPGWLHVALDMPGKSANVLTSALQAELSALLDQLETDPPQVGVVFSSAKPGIFVAGADLVAIAETMDWNRDQVMAFCRKGQSLFDRLSRLPCATVAAIHGVSLGGGLEFALACDCRVATADRKTLLGLPEVKLGLIPGWGGTVRTPRLIGLVPAIDLVTSGRLVAADEALRLGLVDAVVQQDGLLEAAIRELLSAQSLADRRRRLLEPAPFEGEVSSIQRAAAESIERNASVHPEAPLVALEHMVKSAGDPAQAALDGEAAAMARVYGSETNAGLLNTFFLGERAKKLCRYPDATSKPIRGVGIAGAGVMGADIAQICPRQQPLWIFDQDAARAEKVAELCNQRSGSNSAAKRAESPADLATADLVIESIVEDFDAKQRLLTALEQQIQPGTILASNTSVIRIDALASTLKSPERFCGLHFCYPAQQRRLVEVVRGEKTSTDVLASVGDWLRGIGRIPLPVSDAPGFVINRLLCPLINEAGHLLTQGCSLSQIDSAMRDFGFAMGPLEFMDAIGLDTIAAAGAYLIPRLTTPVEPSLILHAMNKAGWKGRKSGRGFYSYPNADGGPVTNEKLQSLVDQYSRTPGEPLTSEALVDRMLMVMLNQAADLLSEGVVSQWSDIDLALVQGIGFPESRGGLMFWAARRGLTELVEEMQRWGAWGAKGPDARRYRVGKALEALSRQSFRVIPGLYPSTD